MTRITRPADDTAGIRQAIRALKAAGYKLDRVDDGEDETFVRTDDEAVGAVTAVDDAVLFVNHSTLPTSHVRFVLGNAPEEVVCDYGVSLEHVLGPLTEAWMDALDRATR